EDVHIFANSIYGINEATCDWETLLLEFEKKNEFKNSESDGAKDECLPSVSRSHDRSVEMFSNTMPAPEDKEIRTATTGSSSDAPIERGFEKEENPSDHEATIYSKKPMPPEDPQCATNFSRNGSESLLGVPTDHYVTTVKEIEDEDLLVVRSCIRDLLERLERIESSDRSTAATTFEEKEHQISISAVPESSSKSGHEQSEHEREKATVDPKKVPLSRQEDGEASNKQVQDEDEEWDSIGITEAKVDRNQILQDLRTFTWVLDTLEKWPDCPSATKEKVLLMALNCHCDLIKERALKIKEDVGLN
ncbi:hypothetical protein OSTOST_17486, partial [Ostertagia ostertagi]